MIKEPVLAGVAVAMLAPIAPMAAPLAAQDTPASVRETSTEAPVNGVVYLYKPTDRCPTDSDGNEIVVCVRRPPGSQYRIPPEVLPKTMKPEYRAFAARNAESIAGAGAAGTGSCTSTRVGGATGCNEQALDAWRRDRAARRAAQEADQPK